MELVFIFCILLLHNIIQVKSLTLYEYASVKVISLKKKKMTPHLTPYAELGRHKQARATSSLMKVSVGLEPHLVFSKCKQTKSHI